MLASQRIESVIDFVDEGPLDPITVEEKRGAAPTLIEMFILSWVSGEFLLLFTSSCTAFSILSH